MRRKTWDLKLIEKHPAEYTLTIDAQLQRGVGSKFDEPKKCYLWDLNKL